MIVVSDTSPINYLVLIGADHVLPVWFGKVVAPPAVMTELQRSKTPAKVSAWAASPPAWLEIRAPGPFAPIGMLGPGESEAIALAQQLNAALLLIANRADRRNAERMNRFQWALSLRERPEVSTAGQATRHRIGARQDPGA